MVVAVGFGGWLREQREAHDLTRERLAAQIGCAADTIRQIEAGRRRPSREVATIIAEFFAVPPAELEGFIQFARGVASTPPAMPSAATAPQPARTAALPTLPTMLIGRESAIEQVISLLSAAKPRLVTLTGPAGIGKTSLALAVATELQSRFPDGVYFVPLAPLSDAALVAPTILRALGTRAAPDRPLVESLHDYLWSRNLLLVLDNFEQLMGAAPLVAEMLRLAPKLRVLVTSRGALRLRGEKEITLPPLGVPVDTEGIAESTAVQLFVERAADARDGFTLTRDNAAAVAEITRQLDGVPLAIELAAARVRVLTPQAMLPRLTSRLELLNDGPVDLPDRQRTLRNAIDWGYDLLAPHEQSLFRTLSVFVGGCTLEAVEAIVGAGSREFSNGPSPAASPSSVPVISTLDGLARMSMVRLAEVDGPGRFLMLETLREYGLEKLAESGGMAAARQAHADLFRDLAEAANKELIGPNQANWLDRLEAEYSNLRAALRWSLDCRSVVDALRLGGALGRFWWLRGHLFEGRAWLTEILAAVPAGEFAATTDLDENLTATRRREIAALGDTLHAAGTLDWAQGDHEQAMVHYGQSLDLRRSIGDKAGVAASLNNQGIVAIDQGDYATARSTFEEAIILYENFGNKQQINNALINLASVLQYQGAYDEARALQERALAISQEMGHQTNTAITLNNLGNTLHLLGDYDRARACLEESAVIRSALGMKVGVAAAWHNLANVIYSQGDRAAARELSERALALRRELGSKVDIGASLADLGGMLLEDGDPAGAAALLHESLTLLWGAHAKDKIGKVLLALAGVAAARGEMEHAARLLGGCAALREELAVPIRPTERGRYERITALSYAGIDEAARRRAWNEGHAMALDKLVALALGR